MMMSNYLIRLLLCVLIGLLAQGAQVWAQSVTGTISGTVVDASGNLVAGANVKLTNERTSDTRNSMTSENGNFQFIAIQPGVYTIRIEARGFRTFVRQNTTLTASEQLSIGKVELSVGEVTESVTTVAEGATVETESSENNALLTANQIEQISVKGRDVVSLLRLIPGVAFENDIESLGSGFGTTTPNVGGNRNTFNSISVDGLGGNDLGSPQVNSGSINLDAIAEVKVQLNNYRAETGRNAGAMIKIVTKSGTKQFHGTGYYYKRHEQFNAQNFFNNKLGLAKPLYRFNTYGFTFGGPVLIPKLYEPQRKKLFFFYSYENAHTITPQAIRQVTVPTALERKGDFSQTVDVNGTKIFIRDPLKTGTCSATNQTACFDGNIVPTNRLNPSGAAILNLFPLPNALNVAVTRRQYNYNFQESVDVPKQNNLLRVDYKASERDTFYVRGSTWWADNKGYAVPAGSANWGLVKQHYTFTDNAITGNWVRIINPRMVNEAQLGVRHSVEKGPPLNDQELARVQRDKLGIRIGQFFPQFNPLNVIPQTSFGGITNAANVTYDGRFPLRGADTYITFSDDVTYSLGKHAIKAGVYVERLRNYEGETGTFAGTFAFNRDVNNPLDSNYAYSNAAIGVFQTYTESSRRPSNEGRGTTVEWYGQDSWKFTRRLSFDFGLRMAWYNHWHHNRGQASAFALETWDRSKTPQLFQPVTVNGARRGRNPITGEIVSSVFIGLIVPNSGNIVNGMVSETDGNYPQGFREQQPVIWEPRFGFAYDLFGKGKTAVRGGFGVFHNTRLPGGTLRGLTLNPPTQFNPTIFYGTFDNFLSAAGVFAPSNVSGFDRDAPTPVIYNYTFGMQQDLKFGTVLNLNYVGSVSRHLLQSRNINLIPYGARFLPQNIDPTTNRALPDNFLRPYPGFGNITYNENTSNANYNALQVQANRRFIKGLQFGVAYTWSKTMDLTDTDGGGVAMYRPLRVWNYGKAGFDQTHIFTVNYTWDVPKLGRKWDHALVKAVFDGWQISGLTSAVSGRPSGVGFSLVDGADLSGGGDGTRIIVTGKAQLPFGERTVDRWFDTSVFARPAVMDPGNAPKDVFRLPGFFNTDLSLFKNFAFRKREQWKLQLRWEMYNLFNHSQFSAVDSTARFESVANGARQVNTNFGAVTSARPARVMQGSLRFTF